MRDLFKVLAALLIIVTLSGSEIQAEFNCELINDLAEVELLHEDIRNFMCSLGRPDSVEEAEATSQKKYVDRASLGFKVYLKGSGLKAEDFIAEIKNSPTYALHLQLRLRRFPYGIA